MAARERYFIDKDVQGALVGRVVTYWFAGIAYVALGNIGSNFYHSPDWTMGQHLSHLFDTYWAWVPSALVILPLIVYDVVRLTNKFAGPIYRLRSHLARLPNEPKFENIRFRSDDYWCDLAEPINALQNQIVELQNQIAVLKTELEESQSDSTPVGERKSRNGKSENVDATACEEPTSPIGVEDAAPEDLAPEATDVQPAPSPATATADADGRTQSGTALLDEASV